MIYENATDTDWPTPEQLSASPPDKPADETPMDNAAASIRLAEKSFDDPQRGRVVVDRSLRQVCNVAIAGSVSRNGYRYSAESLRRAVPLYIGRPVFLDHGVDPETPQARSTRDLVGTVESVRFEETGGADDRSGGLIRGDIRVLDTESGRTFLTLCESDEPGVGMSHVVLARRSRDGTLVEKIEKVVSVDAVMFPATTTRLSEQSSAAGERSRCEELLSKIATLEGDCEKWAREAETLRNAKMRADRERDLLGSGLPARAVTEVFRDQVLHAESDEAARRLIRDRMEVVGEALQVVSDRRDDGPIESIRFVDAVRGRR